jgi:acetylglutamate kinase
MITNSVLVLKVGGALLQTETGMANLMSAIKDMTAAGQKIVV